jgi:AcrR family transcriptional regulator
MSAEADPSPTAATRLRADARRNRERLLLAARDVFVEQGADAPLDEIARRAGVGIATLYRRFPDRQALMQAVALEVLRRVADEARLALAEEPDPFRALARYMHRVLDVRIAAVMPVLVGSVQLADEEVERARQAAVEPVLAMIERARADGTLRSDAAFSDVGLLLVRLSRPLPAPITREVDSGLAHRHLDLALAGLRAAPEGAAGPLDGPALTLAELRALDGAGAPDRGSDTE